MDRSLMKGYYGISKALGQTEFVGTSTGDTIGLVIASVDPMLKDSMKLANSVRSVSLLSTLEQVRKLWLLMMP